MPVGAHDCRVMPIEVCKMRPITQRNHKPRKHHLLETFLDEFRAEYTISGTLSVTQQYWGKKRKRVYSPKGCKEKRYTSSMASSCMSEVALES